MILVISFWWAYFYDEYQKSKQIEAFENSNLFQANLSETDLENQRIANIKKMQEQEKFLEKENELLIKKEKIIESTWANIEEKTNEENIEKKWTGNVEKTEKQPKVSEKSKIDTEIEFLEWYYNDIWEKNLKQAYEKSSKKVSFSTYYSRYKDVENAKINGIKKVEWTENKYLVDVNLTEKWETTNYKVTKSIWWHEEGSLKILASETLSSFNLSKWYDYITNAQLKQEIDSWKNDYIILDAREDLEVEVGRMPWSTHIRFADLKNWEYQTLDKSKIVYVYCRSWIRWKKVTSFLKEKWLKSKYIENWASSWYAFWGYWEWKIKVSSVYTQDYYWKVFMKQELDEKLKEGAFLIDSRWIEENKKWHPTWAINVPLVDLPRWDWDWYIQKIPEKSEIITICDGYVNCFYAKIVWIELEKRGYKYIWVHSLTYN